MSMYDACCPKCKKRFGWKGSARDRPSCPKCGHQISLEQIEADAKQIDDFLQLLSTNKGEVLKQQRIMSGLTIDQAAKQLGLTISQLEELEDPDNIVTISMNLKKKIREVYQLD